LILFDGVHQEIGFTDLRVNIPDRHFGTKQPGHVEHWPELRARDACWRRICAGMNGWVSA
jgi:hypothetical protein